jgi:hypothetical protein
MTISSSSAAQGAGPRRRPAVLAWTLWVLVVLGLLMTTWLDHRLRQAGRPDLAGTNAATIAYLLAAVSAATVGAVLASRRPRHPVGWLLLALGLSVAASGLSEGYASYGLLARPGALPAAAYQQRASILPAALLGFILLLTPTGSPPSARWRWWARMIAAAPVVAVLSLAVQPFGLPYRSVGNPLAVPVLADVLVPVAAVAGTLTVLGIPVGGWSLVVRFRRTRGVERLQLRWLVFAAALVAVGVAVMVVLIVTDHEASVGWISGACLALLPAATGAAILRYRLYDLDRIISRTLAWALLTLLLAGGYALVVLGVGQVLGQSSSLAVAAATLAVAAAFTPARRRIQQVVDRRFNRRRYDAARTIGAFSDRLRQQVDLDTLTGELLAVVEETMQPTRASLWLRRQPPPGTVGAALVR